MPEHGRALIKSFLAQYKRIMEETMEIQLVLCLIQKATCDPATEVIVNQEFEIVEVESQIVEVASSLSSILSGQKSLHAIIPALPFAP